MATRNFLTPEQNARALDLLKSKTTSAQDVSLYIGQCLEDKFKTHPLWRATRPLRLGSWSRDELCSKSDIDLFFFGREEDVKNFVRDISEQGVKIRYRMPLDPKDWTVGVEAFDILALLSAQSFFAEDTAALQQQICMIEARGAKYTQKLFQHMMKERKERARRYDSIANYLEPNLKYGAGGLRDLEQGLMIDRLFVSLQDLNQKARESLLATKSHFLKVRHFLHLSGAGDILVGPLQQECAQFFGFADTKTFMSQVERDLADVSFYADVVAERARASRAQSEKILRTELETVDQALAALNKNPSVLMQAHIRELKFKLRERKKMGLALEKYFNAKMTDEFVRALFRSGLLHQIVPALERVRGHVQHDQYHRFSVDAHTLQAVREVLRVKNHPRLLGRLASLARELAPSEWDILVWSALYHDLGKGQKGDHSTIGADLVKRDLVSMGVSLKLTANVAWMVQSHLLLSGASFRQNPHASSTWAELFKRGVKGRRILKLALFTAIDIRATNPEAWNDWKERLLFDLAQTLQSPQASHLNALLELAERRRLKVMPHFLAKLDPVIFEGVPHSMLLADALKLKKAKGSMPHLVLRNRRREIWVRMHSHTDKSGLFLSFTRQLAQAGLGVQEAFVQTYAEWGAYDWFKIKTSKSLTQVRRLLSADLRHEVNVPDVRFEKIDLISQDEGAAIISFRGRDQKGALLSAAKNLHRVGLEIVSAKVHTWGRQIEDVFTVKSTPDLAERLQALREAPEKTSNVT